MKLTSCLVAHSLQILRHNAHHKNLLHVMARRITNIDHLQQGVLDFVVEGSIRHSIVAVSTLAHSCCCKAYGYGSAGDSGARWAAGSGRAEHSALPCHALPATRVDAAEPSD